MTDVVFGGLTYTVPVEVDLGPMDSPADLPGALVRYLDGVAALLAAVPGLREEGHRYVCHQELVRDQGRPMRAAPLPKGVLRGRPRYCYANTLALMRGRPGLRYVEGYAIPWEQGRAGIPITHAWAINANGRVWDPTWPEPEHSAYYGIVFELADVKRFNALDEDTFGILETEYLIGSPLLRTGRLWPEERRG